MGIENERSGEVEIGGEMEIVDKTENTSPSLRREERKGSVCVHACTCVCLCVCVCVCVY